MEAATSRKIKDGRAYNHFFPSAAKNTVTVRKNSNVYHTVAFIPKVVQETLWHTEEISKHLKRDNTYETCKNIWHFVYGHIAYKKDADGYEQIRSPARAWHDRYKGVDCDCYSVFISSVLTNLKIPHTLRITKYNRDYFQHIYPIVPVRNGHLTIDCVTDRFNYEVPFSEKKDYPMDLQYLNGFDDEFAGLEEEFSGHEEENISGLNEPGDDLGKLLMNNLSHRLNNEYGLNGRRRKKSPHPESSEPEGEYSEPKPKKRKFFGKLLHAINRFNPATILLRKGILVAMKLNLKNVAKRLRWSYLTPAQAKEKQMNPTEFKKLLKARMKLEKIFYGTGGKLQNLKKAILIGKGNRDKAVNGIESLGMIEIDSSLDGMDEYTPVSELLGMEMYQSEMEGLGQLGEPLTLTSIAAAAGVIAGIVGMLKQVKDLFPGKTKEGGDFDPEANAASENQPLPAAADKANNDLPAADAGKNAGAGDDEKPPGFWDKNKTWLKPVAIGAGVLTVVGIGYAVLQSKKPPAPVRSSRGGSLSGAPKNKRRRKNHHRKTNRQHKKKAVALL